MIDLRLLQQIPRSMINMIIGKTRNSKIAMIIPILPPNINLALPLCRLHKILRQQLPLLVEIIRCAHIDQDV